MKNDFYIDFKKNLDSENFCKNSYSRLVDKHITDLKCNAAECGGLFGLKKCIGYAIEKYQILYNLKRQNDEIFSQILHDIKSPMLSIKYALDNKDKTQLEEEIYDISLNVLHIISDFLLLYNFSDGYKTLVMSEFYPVDVIKEQVRFFNPFARKKKVKFIFKVDDNISLYTSQSLFSRIVSNLISNAVKYSPVDSEILIELKKSGHDVLFALTNQILNPSAFVLKNLFEKFSTTGGNSSFGLGLFISKRLADKINSKLRAKKVGKNIVFELRISKIANQNQSR